MHRLVRGMIRIGAMIKPLQLFLSLGLLLSTTNVLLLLVQGSTAGWDRGVAAGLCPRSCSGHGACISRDSDIYCSCFPGYHGGDCSYRLCPAGRAWFDVPYEDNAAHAPYTECSGMGICDRETGDCACRAGFTGAACDQMICPMGTASSGADSICSGHGRCLSLRRAASFVDYVQFFRSVQYEGWDADSVHGCDCDDGWEGSSCSRRKCPYGDDPVTTGQVAELQLLDCSCSGGACAAGSAFRLSFRGRSSRPIPYSASASLLESILEEIPGLEDVTVAIVEDKASICDVSGTVTRITFNLPQGNVPALVATAGAGLSVAVITDGAASIINPFVSSVAGTKELVECSNRGLCDRSTGTCDCFRGYTSSDGSGGAGSRGDCGHFYLYEDDTSSAGKYCPVAVNPITSIPAVCSGKGTCIGGSCVCNTGYGGPACSEKLCQATRSWFGDISADRKSGDSTAACSGVGDCDGSTGTCRNCGGSMGVFDGDSCEFLACANNGSSAPCSLVGTCLSLRDVAHIANNDQGEVAGRVYETPWDANMVRGCSCYRRIASDNQYPDNQQLPLHDTFNSIAETFDPVLLYAGPYAYAAASRTSYSCSQKLCPSGIDPQSRNAQEGVTEIQRIHCRGADTGTFRLGFRGNWSDPIPHNVNAAGLKLALEGILTINSVSVTLDALSLCNNDKDAALVEFLTEFGDLPLLDVDASKLSVSPNPPPAVSRHLVRVTEKRKGTFVELECSAQGVCDRWTGVCKCFTGFGSSAGLPGTQGERGDCTFVDKFYMRADSRLASEL